MNTTIQDLKKQREEKHTALFNSCGVFWAFSNEQFDKNKTPLQDGEKYVSIGAGGYVPKFSLDRLLDGMEEIRKWFKKESTANKDIRRAHILSELSNYECFYTGDISEALAALGEGYTAKEVRKVYQDNIELYA